MSDEADKLSLQLDELRLKYGRIAVVEVGEQTFAFRPPNRMEYQRYHDKRASGSIYESQHEISQACLVFPGVADFKKLIDDRPAIVTQSGGFWDSVVDLAFVREGLVSKKL